MPATEPHKKSKSLVDSANKSKKTREVMWICGGQLGALINNFLLLKLLTFNLSVGEYGSYALWVAILLFIRQIFLDPISIILSKESVNDNCLKISGLSSLQVLRYISDKLLLGAITIGSGLLLLNLTYFTDVRISTFVIPALFYLVSNGVFGVYVNILNTIKQRRVAAIGMLIESFLKLCFVFFVNEKFSKSLDKSINAVVVSSIMALILVRALSCGFYRPLQITSNEFTSLAKTLLCKSIPLLASTLLIAIKGVSDKLVIASFIGVEDFAAYNILLQVGFIPLLLIIGVVQTYAGPAILKNSCDASDKQVASNKYIKAIALLIIKIGCILTVGSVFLAEPVFTFLVGDQYINHSNQLPYFVLAGTVAGLAGLLNVGVVGAFEPKKVGFLMFISVGFGFLIQILSVHFYGWWGSVFGLLFSNVLSVVILGGSLLLKQSSTVDK
jgi:O-antigen/teichoic acid export membrane protein